MSARERGKKPKNLRRKTETRQVKTTFRIYSEGEATEPEYIDILKRLPELAESVSIDIAIEQVGATPMTLVDSACADKRRADLDVDYYWCVFDVESPKAHPYLHDARQKARDNEVLLAISNPCFEIWLVLHHQYVAKYLSTDEAVRLRKSLDNSDLKHLDAELYRPLISRAMVNAKRLRVKHEKDGTSFPETNPSSSFDVLVQSLRDTAIRLNGGQKGAENESTQQ